MKITNTTQKTSFQGIYNNKFFLKSMKFAGENGALFSATTSLILSTIARPIAIMSTPKTNKEDKKYAVAKSLSSSAVGYLIIGTASLPISKAVKKIDNNPTEFLKKETIKNLQQGAKTLQKSKSYAFATQIFKLGIGFLVAAPKSILTCALIPVMMKLFFKNKPENTQQKTSIPNFTGKFDPVNKISKGISKIINNDKFQKFIDKYKDTNFQQHIMVLTDSLLTAVFVHQTAHSKNINENRKNPLIINSLLSTGLCITAGYGINSALNNKSEKFIRKFEEVNKNLPNLEKYVEGIRIAKPALILGGLYYIVIPLISTFFSDKIGKNKTTQQKT